MFYSDDLLKILSILSIRHNLGKGNKCTKYVFLQTTSFLISFDLTAKNLQIDLQLRFSRIPNLKHRPLTVKIFSYPLLHSSSRFILLFLMVAFHQIAAFWKSRCPYVHTNAYGFEQWGLQRSRLSQLFEVYGHLKFYCTTYHANQTTLETLQPAIILCCQFPGISSTKELTGHNIWVIFSRCHSPFQSNSIQLLWAAQESPQK